MTKEGKFSLWVAGHKYRDNLSFITARQTAYKYGLRNAFTRVKDHQKRIVFEMQHQVVRIDVKNLRK